MILLSCSKHCSEESPALAASTPPVIVDNLSVVLYENCCLEKIILEATTPLRLPVETSKPTSEEKAHVRGVMDEFAAENLEVYHVFTSKFGKSKPRKHYISVCVCKEVIKFSVIYLFPVSEHTDSLSLSEFTVASGYLFRFHKMH